MKTQKLSFILAFIITSLLSISGVGFVAAYMYQTVYIDVANAQGEVIQGEFLLNPKEIACLNYDSVDILDKLNMGDRIVGMIKGAEAPKHLQKYVDDSSIVDLGSMQEPDMVMLAKLKPDVILSSAYTTKLYDEFVKIAPTMAVVVNGKDGVLNAVRNIAVKHAILMNKTKDMKKILGNIDLKVERLSQRHKGRRAIQTIFVGEDLHILGATAPRKEDEAANSSVLMTDLGFDNVGKDFDYNTEKTSFDYILEQNPEFIFVLDKNVATKSDAPKAQDILLKNEKLIQTEAFKDNKVIFLTPENTWYANSGGLTAMETMLQNFASLPPKKKSLATKNTTQAQPSSSEANQAPADQPSEN